MGAGVVLVVQGVVVCFWVPNSSCFNSCEERCGVVVESLPLLLLLWLLE
jgi:hypothetical protein